LVSQSRPALPAVNHAHDVARLADFFVVYHADGAVFAGLGRSRYRQRAVVVEGEFAVTSDEEEAAVRDSHAVIDEAKAAGAHVFAGGIDETVTPALVSANGTVVEGGYPWAPPLNGGFTVLELPSREEAVAWAARLAKACRCDQELRVFGFDPQS